MYYLTLTFSILRSCLFAILPKCRSALHEVEQTEQSLINSFKLFLATVLTQCMFIQYVCVRKWAGLTLFRVILFHSGDEVWSRVEVVWAGLLQATQAVEGMLCGGAAGEGPAARDARVARPALHLQVKGLESCHRHLALTPTWSPNEKKIKQIEAEGTQFFSQQIPVAVLLGPAVVCVSVEVERTRISSLAVCALKISELSKTSFVF